MKRVYFYGLAFLLGFASLAIEIILARAIAPYWGSGTLVWSFVVAVVLLVLSLGYWYGGKLADRYPDEKHLLGFLLPGALLLLPLPFLLPDSSFTLVAFFLLASLPLFAMGASSPWILRILTQDVAHTGQLAGRLFALSTIGSFLGSVSASLLLLPFLGTRNSLLLLGTLFLAYLFLYRLKFLPFVFLFLPLFFLPKPDDGSIWQKESLDQLVRVFKDGRDTTLVLNNPDNIQSTYRPGRYLTGGYWDAPLLLAPARGNLPRRILILGNGAGSSARLLHHYLPGSSIDTVEADPVVSYAAKKFFAFKEDSRLRLYKQDARRFLQEEQKKERWELVFVDVYDSSFIPFQFATREFYQEIKEDMTPGGLLLLNVNYSKNKKVVANLSRSAQSVFANGAFYQISPSNAILLFSRKPLRQSFASPVTGQKITLEPLPSGGQVWTDDKSNIEILFPF